jgi:hypothetical protein
MAKSKKNEPLCPFHRAEGAMNELTTEWRAKAAELSPQAAKALAQSLKSLRNVLDRRIHDIEEKERVGGSMNDER